MCSGGGKWGSDIWGTRKKCMEQVGEQGRGLGKGSTGGKMGKGCTLWGKHGGTGGRGSVAKGHMKQGECRERDTVENSLGEGECGVRVVRGKGTREGACSTGENVGKRLHGAKGGFREGCMVQRGAWKRGTWCRGDMQSERSVGKRCKGRGAGTGTYKVQGKWSIL